MAPDSKVKVRVRVFGIIFSWLGLGLGSLLLGTHAFSTRRVIPLPLFAKAI